MRRTALITLVAAALWPGISLADDIQGLPVDLTKQSAGFWSDWNTLQQTDKWKKLDKSVGLAGKRQAAIQEGMKKHQQAILSVSLQDLGSTAKFLNAAASNSAGADTSNAVATALQMRASPQMVKAAAPMVTRQAQSQVQQWRATLSTGVQGLPGVYLGDNAEINAGVPAGYEPVSGGSWGCGE